MKIAEVFHSIQGEGKLAGVPSVFVRTSGCNLRCVWCDTPYASWDPQGQERAVDELVEQVLAIDCRHVVVTGGEPMIQPQAPPLIRRLREAGRHVTVETAGTVWQDVEADLASLSPKLAHSTPPAEMDAAWHVRHEQRRLNVPVLQRFINQWPDFQLKFVVSSEADLDEIDRVLGQLHRWKPEDVLLMPEGTDDATLHRRSLWLADICRDRGYRLTPRMHVTLWGNKRGV